MKYRWAFLSVFAASMGCALPFSHNLPPAPQLMHPGPGVDGPGPGVMTIGDPGPPVAMTTSQVAFVGPEGMIVNWDAYSSGAFDSEPLICPGRYNFPQGSIYRLKLTSVPGRPGLELYPTIEIGPTVPRTDAYLAHNSIPFQLTDEDFDQVVTGNFVTKVIYLPDAEYQELALAGVETLVSTRLDPGVDPIVEADRRGAILAIIRLGNKDLEVPGIEGVEGGNGEVMADDGYGPGVQQTGGFVPPGGPPSYVSGLTAPEYGMPITGTPIGLPGPPHIPLGGPAGLKRHVIKNHTFTHIPQPSHKTKIHVKQSPGMSYPRPPRHAYIHESARTSWLPNFSALGAKRGAVVADDCPPE